MGHKQNPKPGIWERDYWGEREVMEWETDSIRLKTDDQNATNKFREIIK